MDFPLGAVSIDIEERLKALDKAERAGGSESRVPLGSRSAVHGSDPTAAPTVPLGSSPQTSGPDSSLCGPTLRAPGSDLGSRSSSIPSPSHPPSPFDGLPVIHLPGCSSLALPPRALLKKRPTHPSFGSRYAHQTGQTSESSPAPKASRSRQQQGVGDSSLLAPETSARWSEEGDNGSRGDGRWGEFDVEAARRELTGPQVEASLLPVMPRHSRTLLLGADDDDGESGTKT